MCLTVNNIVFFFALFASLRDIIIQHNNGKHENQEHIF
jgi:hypothetical protein